MRNDASLKVIRERRASTHIASESLILRVKNDKVTRRGEEVITAAREEVKRDDAVVLVILKKLPADPDAEEGRTGRPVGAVDDLDVVGDLEPGGDGAAVVLVDAGDGAFEDGADFGSGKGDLHDGVAEGERGEDTATGDVAGLDGGTDTASVDESEVRALSEANGLVKAVFQHGIRHNLAEKAVTALAACLVKLVHGKANNFVGEFLERSAPRVYQSLSLRVLDSGVGQVGRSAVVRERLAIGVEGHVDVPEELTPAPRGNNEDLIALGVLDDGGVVTESAGHGAQGSVAVTTDDKGDALSLSSKSLVDIVAQVSESNDTLDVGGVADLVDGVLNRRDRVREGGELANAGDGGSGLGGDADDGDAVLLENVPRLDVVAQALVLRLDVGRNGREGDVVEELAQLLVAAIPLVVAQGHDVVLKQVDRLGDLLGSVEGVEESALELVTGVDDEVVGVVGTELIKDGLDTGDAAETATLRTGAVRAGGGELVQMSVHIVHVDERCE